MAIYYLAACLDTREYIKPHPFGHGAKWDEITESRFSAALCHLLLERWRGLRVAIYPDSWDQYDNVISEFKNISAECDHGTDAEKGIRNGPSRPSFVVKIPEPPAPG